MLAGGGPQEQLALLNARIERHVALIRSSSDVDAFAKEREESEVMNSALTLSDSIRALLTACEVDLGSGSVSFSPTAPKPQSFLTVHGALRDSRITLGLIEVMVRGSAAIEKRGPWLQQLSDAYDKSVCCVPPNRATDEDASAGGGGHGGEWDCSSANLRLGKSIALFLSDGIIAFQGGPSFLHALEDHEEGDRGVGGSASPPLSATVLLALGEAMGAAGHPFVPFLGQLLRVMSKLKPLLARCFVPFSPLPSPSVTDEASSSARRATSPSRSLIELLINVSATAADACVTHEVWACLRALLGSNKPLTSAHVVDQLGPFVRAIARAIAPPSPDACCLPPCSGEEDSDEAFQHATHTPTGAWYVNCRQGLRLVATMIGDRAFGTARTRLADCPALLAAALKVVGVLQQRRLSSSSPAGVGVSGGGGAGKASAEGPSSGYTHDALVFHECYHVLKVFIIKPKKALSVRFLLTANREAVLHFIMDYHVFIVQQGADGGAAGGGGESRGLDADTLVASEAERKLLAGALCRTEPLDADEMYTLRHFIDVDARWGSS